MPRLINRSQRDSFRVLQAKIQELVDSPLREIGLIFQSTLIHLQSLTESEATGINLPAIVNDLNVSLEHLPSTLSERFLFDTGMIQATVEELSQGAVQLNTMIIPRSGKPWAHGTLPLPWIRGENQKFVHLIFFRGEDTLDDVNLLSYPFMIHELGHNFLLRYDTHLTESFTSQLDKITNRLRLLSIADTGAERVKSQTRIESIRTLWLPTSDHKNWMHELAIDIFAVWVCGPAYLAAFQDEMEAPNVKPYLITQEHPPNAVRAAALSEVGKRLGWGRYIGGLEKLVGEWWKSRQENLDTDYNLYLALADTTIVDACVSSALVMCEELKIPMCTAESINNLRAIISRNETPDFGTELILAAWLIQQEQGEAAYLKWEPLVLRDLIRCITL